MRKVDFNLNAKTSAYCVLIGQGLEEFGDELIKAVSGRKVLIAVDRGAANTALTPLLSLIGETASCFIHYVDGGENAKSFNSLLQLLGALVENGFTRNDLILNLGGGTIGDLGGFAASIYMRGIDYINVPTTFLSMIDSAMGGKTGIDFQGIKNNVGSFHQPKLVLCASGILDTLPEKELLSGYGEALKYYCISGSNTILESIERKRIDPCLIEECCSIKRDHVVDDVLDVGKRRILNLGHTFGHAFEAASAFSLAHGEAVVLGIIAAMRLAARLGFVNDDMPLMIQKLASASGFGMDYVSYAKIASDLIIHDKKSNSGSIEMVFISEPGKPFLRSVPIDSLVRFLQEA